MRKGGDKTITVLYFVSGGTGTTVRVMTRYGEDEISEDNLRHYFELVHNEPSRTAWERLLEDEP